MSTAVCISNELHTKGTEPTIPQQQPCFGPKPCTLTALTFWGDCIRYRDATTRAAHKITRHAGGTKLCATKGSDRWCKTMSRGWALAIRVKQTAAPGAASGSQAAAVHSCLQQYVGWNVFLGNQDSVPCWVCSVPKSILLVCLCISGVEWSSAFLYHEEWWHRAAGYE